MPIPATVGTAMRADTVRNVSRSRFFYGWWISATCALGLFLGPIPIGIFAFGIFLKPLATEFHAGRGTVSLAQTLATFMLALSLPVAGRLIDHFGPKKIILACTVAAGAILLATSFLSARIWELCLFFALLGVATCGISPVSYCNVVTHWFDRCRGLALGVMMFGLGAGAVIMPSIAQYVIANFGWRIAYSAAGCAMLLIAFSIQAMFLKDRPSEIGLVPDGGGSFRSSPEDSDHGVTWNEARGDRTFWILFCAFTLVSASVQACLAHLAAILADRGAAAQTAALATSLFGVGVMIGRTATGYLLDRLFAPRVAAVIFGAAACGIGALRIATSQEVAFVAAFFVGLGLGAEVDIMAYLTSRYFGLRSFGTIYGITFAGFGLAGGLGVYLMGAAFDRSGSYASMLAVFCVATLIGALLLLRLGAYRYQVRTAREDAPASGLLPLES